MTKATKIDLEKLRTLIEGKRIGLLMNASALTEDGRYLIDVMHFEWKANIARMFAMEHGLRSEF